MQVAAGSDFSCARLAGGRVYCWGANAVGQLGRGSAAASNTAVQVMGLEDAVDLDAGTVHACAVRATGRVVCWGDGGNGRLGDGFKMDRLAPVETAVTDAVRVATGGEHTCALRVGGLLSCWGRNDRGQLGVAGGDLAVATEVTLPLRVVDVSGGGKHSCAILEDGSGLCWGENGARQLGDGSMTDRGAPTVVTTLAAARDVASGGDFNCARVGGARVQVACWGGNAGGQLGDGSTDRSAARRADRRRVSRMARSQLTAGDAATLARGSTTVALCSAGASNSGRVPRRRHVLRPPDARFGRRCAAASVHVSAGAEHTCAARGDGTALCWGTGADGRLGNDDTVDSLVPVAVVGLP